MESLRTSYRLRPVTVLLCSQPENPGPSLLILIEFSGEKDAKGEIRTFSHSCG